MSVFPNFQIPTVFYVYFTVFTFDHARVAKYAYFVYFVRIQTTRIQCCILSVFCACILCHRIQVYFWCILTPYSVCNLRTPGTPKYMKYGQIHNIRVLACSHTIRAKYANEVANTARMLRHGSRPSTSPPPQGAAAPAAPHPRSPPAPRA